MKIAYPVVPVALPSKKAAASIRGVASGLSSFVKGTEAEKHKPARIAYTTGGG
jgi:hypothetical protein